jgi:hypothetical protein
LKKLSDPAIENLKQEHIKKIMVATATMTENFMEALDIPKDAYQAKAMIGLFFYPFMAHEVRKS